MASRDLQALISAVRDLVRNQGHVIFAELEDRFPEMFGGDLNIPLPGYPNILYWSGFSEIGCEVIEELCNSRQLFVRPSSSLAYLLHGRGLKLPLANEIGLKTKKLAWYPVELHHEPLHESEFERVASAVVAANKLTAPLRP